MRLHARLLSAFRSRQQEPLYVELLHVLNLPDLEPVERIGEFWSYPQSRAFAELLIDSEGGPSRPGGARRHAAGVRPLTGMIGSLSTAWV